MPWYSNKRLQLLFIAACLILLVLFGRLPSAERWAQVLTNAAHGPVSALIAMIIFHLRRANESRPASLYRHWLSSVGATTLLGALIEAVQFTIGRDAELTDIMTDLCGAIAGAGLCVFRSARQLPQDQVSRAARYASLLSALVATGIFIAPVVIMPAAYATRNVRFPVLMEGSSLLGSYFMQPFWIETRREPEGYRVRSTPEEDWGVGLFEVLPDWRQCNTLIIDLFNPADASLGLRVRVFDKAHGLTGRHGFVSSVTLQPRARTRWRIPLQEVRRAAGTEHVDLARVQGLVLYGVPDNKAQDFFVLEMRLE